MLRAGSRYRLDPTAMEIDLWRFEEALKAAPTGSAVGDREQAAAAYGGEFAADEDFTWSEPVRVTLRGRAVDNLLALAAQRREAEDRDGALAATGEGIAHDPHAEELYQAAISLQIELGRPDAARRPFRLLETRLAELGRQPNASSPGLVD